jgi:hypothetical protein
VCDHGRIVRNTNGHPLLSYSRELKKRALQVRNTATHGSALSLRPGLKEANLNFDQEMKQTDVN